VDHPSEQPDQRIAGDALRRTRLANERTYLAWWRTGFTALGVSLAVAKVVPAITKGPQWAYTVLGIGFAIVGVAFLWFGLVRRQAVEDALDRGEYSAIDRRIVRGLTVIGMALGIGVLALIIGSA
jgi:putative membrane protein